MDSGHTRCGDVPTWSSVCLPGWTGSRVAQVGGPYASTTRPGRVRRPLTGQPPQCESADEQAEVAQRNVVVVAQNQQVDDDSGQPGGHDDGAVAWPDRHEEPGQDLDHADG